MCCLEFCHDLPSAVAYGIAHVHPENARAVAAGITAFFIVQLWKYAIERKSVVEFCDFWQPAEHDESRCREENCDHSFQPQSWACVRRVTSDREHADIAGNWQGYWNHDLSPVTIPSKSFGFPQRGLVAFRLTSRGLIDLASFSFHAFAFFFFFFFFFFFRADVFFGQVTLVSSAFPTNADGIDWTCSFTV
jgi:hypothetical protein